jgi:hypothetical protein
MTVSYRSLARTLMRGKKLWQCSRGKPVATGLGIHSEQSAGMSTYLTLDKVRRSRAEIKVQYLVVGKISQ